LKYCNTTIAEKDELEGIWHSFLDEKNTDSVKTQSYIMAGFMSSIHEDQVKSFQSKFFENVHHVFATKSKEYAKEFFSTLFPSGDNLKEFLEEVNVLIGKTKSEDLALTRQLNESKDDLQRRIKCHDCTNKYLGI